MGPEANTIKIKMSHPTLPILYHHFGCVCPSFESLEIIRLVAKGRPIIDVGSGNGYWTYMLRRMKDGKNNLEVTPIDNGISEWRTMWVGDTVEIDGAKWLQQHADGKDHVLLLVYPQVGLEFTSTMIKAYSKFVAFRNVLSCLTEQQRVRLSLSPALRTPMATPRSPRSCW